MLSVIAAAHNQIGHHMLFLEGSHQYTTGPYTVIVVDNHSTDGSAEFFEANGCQVIRKRWLLVSPSRIVERYHRQFEELGRTVCSPRWSSAVTTVSTLLTVACVVITKNEEHNLPDCLQPVHWVDEGVVIDAESSDRTADLARGGKAKEGNRRDARKLTQACLHTASLLEDIQPISQGMGNDHAVL